VLLAGASGAGKSTLTMAFLEWLLERGYQVCLLDPEGDYDHVERLVVLGSAERAPTLDEVQAVLDDPDRGVVVNLLGLGLEERPPFCEALLARLHQLRVVTGRPHWIVIDEAHHVMPPERWPDDAPYDERLQGTLLITVHPDRLAPTVLQRLDLLVSIGGDAAQAVAVVADATARPLPAGLTAPGEGQGLAWHLRQGPGPVASGDDAPRPPRGDAGAPDAVQLFDLARPRGATRRHRRKYAAGDLGPERSFWFRGPDGRLNLRAQNLAIFSQIAEGVDDATWTYHLRRGDYSGWIRDAIKDGDLADEIAEVERDATADARTTRRHVRGALEARYTAPARPDPIS
jgi:hypothetical protein